MFKLSVIFLLQVIIFSYDVTKVTSQANNSDFENIAFVELGTYRGFTNDGAEYQKTYFVSRFTLSSWSGSRSFCNSYKMDLLTLETGVESQTFQNYLGNNSYVKNIADAHFWIDGMAVTLLSKTEWFWTNTGKKVSFPISWFGNEPNNNVGNEYCLFVRTSSTTPGFGDGNCNTLSVYVACQKIEFWIPKKN